MIVLCMIFFQVCCFYIAHTISDYNKHWLNVLRKASTGYGCTNDSLWINVQLLQHRQESSKMSQNVFGIQVISAFQVFLTLAQYFSNYRLIMRWYEDNPKNTNQRARAIQVGVPLSGSTVIDRETGQGEGVAVPEADRDAHTTPLYNVKKNAIPGIPLIDEDGEEIVESEMEADNSKE